MRDLNNIETLIRIVGSFLGYKRDDRQKTTTLNIVKSEFNKRPSIDERKLKEQLTIGAVKTISRYAYVANLLIPDIRAGRYDGEPIKEVKKEMLSSSNLYKAMDAIGVKDDVDRVLIDYYIDAVWEQSDITIEEVRHFTDKAIEWMKSLPKEKRKTSVFLELCKRSSTLSKHLSKEKAMEKAQEWLKENESLDDELDTFYDSICGGESDD